MTLQVQVQYVSETSSPSVTILSDVTGNVRNQPTLRPLDVGEYFSNFFGIDSEELSEVERELLLQAIYVEDKIRRLAVSNCLWWSKPLVNICEDNFIVFEWWFSFKKLTFYVSQNNVEIVKVWGPDIETEMEDLSLELDDSDGFLCLWRWMIS
jgi:hypothetical protein